MRSSRHFWMAALLLFALSACQQKSKDGIDTMHWDRDMCVRCQMAISERKYAVQVVNPQNGKHYKFDDIGCAVLWFDEADIGWKENAKILITDAKTGQWIDARKAIYTDDSITPMAFGFSAYTKETLPKGHHTISYPEVARKIPIIEHLNTEKVKAQK